MAGQTYVTRALALLEADFRAIALLALADWERLELVEPELFGAVAALQRPSWGTWNFLLQSLRNARKAQLRGGRSSVREAIEGARTLQAILSLLDTTCPPELTGAAAPLVTFLGNKVRIKRVGEALSLPIALRNQVAHFPPSDDAGWEAIRSALAPLIAWHAEHPNAILADNGAWPQPWFFEKHGDVWAFNGADKDFAVSYASPGSGRPCSVPEQAGAFVRAIQRLLGKTDVQEQSFHRLLARLAPEDIRGVVLGDFLVGPPVGRGGFATVHVGRQLSTGRKVAVKILHDGLTEDVHLRFQQEAAFLSRINHSAVVGVVSCGEDVWSVPRFVDLKDEPWFQQLTRGASVKTYIALEWIDGQTLEELFQKIYVEKTTQRPSLDVLRRWFHQSADALAAVHAAGLIHRDIKPANLMVTSDGQAVRLMDFGVARSEDENRTLMTSTGYAMGTPPYMSPEQLAAHDADAEVGPASDIYSLCATFYELATGQRLYAHDRETSDTVRRRKLRGDPPIRPASSPWMPWELQVILLGGLEADSADRYRTAAALARDLQHWERDEPIEYRRPSFSRRARLGYRRHRAAVHVTAFVGIAALAGAGLYVHNIRSERARADESAALATTRETEAVAAKNEANGLAANLFEAKGKEELAAGHPGPASVALAEAYRLSPEPSRVLRFLLSRALTGIPDLTIWKPDTRAVRFLDNASIAVFTTTEVERDDRATGSRLGTQRYAGYDTTPRVLPDGRIAILARSGERTSRIIDASRSIGLGTGVDTTPTSLPFDPGANRVVTGGPGTAVVIDARSGVLVAAIDLPGRDRRTVPAVTFDPTGTSVWTRQGTEGDGVVARLDLGTGPREIVVDATDLPVFSTDRTRAVVAGRAGVRVLDVKTGVLRATIARSNALVLAVGPRADRIVLATRTHESDKQRVSVWNGDGALLTTLDGDPCWRGDTSTPVTRDSCGLAISSDGSRLAVVLDALTIVDLPTGRTERILEPSASELEFSPDGTELAGVAGDDVTGTRRAVVWRLGPSRAIPLDGLVAVAPGGERVARTGAHGVELWDVRAHRPLATLPAAESPLGFLGEGGERFVTTTATDVHVYDGRTGEPLVQRAHGGSATLDPSGARLALVGTSLRLWDGDPAHAFIDTGLVPEDVRWSAQGSELIVTVQHPLDTYAGIVTSDIVAIDAKTGAAGNRVDARLDNMPRFIAVDRAARLVAVNEQVFDMVDGMTRRASSGWVTAFSPDSTLALIGSVEEIGSIVKFPDMVPRCMMGVGIDEQAFDATGTFVISNAGTITDARDCAEVVALPGELAWLSGVVYGVSDDGRIEAWKPRLEQRAPAEISRIVAANAGWTLANGQVVVDHTHDTPHTSD